MEASVNSSNKAVEDWIKMSLKQLSLETKSHVFWLGKNSKHLLNTFSNTEVLPCKVEDIVDQIRSVFRTQSSVVFFQQINQYFPVFSIVYYVIPIHVHIEFYPFHLFWKFNDS